MTDDRSLERAARSFIESGPTRAPERAVEAALVQIETTSQERSLWVPWRTTMTTPARVAAAAVIGVLAIGGALFLFGRAGQPNVGPPAPSAMPSTSPTSSAAAATSPSVVPPTAIPDGPLAAGTYATTPFHLAQVLSCMSPAQPGCSEPEDDSIRATLTVPDGWAGFGYGVWLTDEGNSAPAGAAMGFSRGGWLYTDPCLTPPLREAGVKPEVAVGPTVDDFANALADHPLLDATDPVPVTLGGYSGKYVDLHLPEDLTGCETDYRPWEPGIYAQGPGHRWQLWILDVDGVRVVVAAMDYAGTSAQDHAELEAIVQSIQFEP